MSAAAVERTPKGWIITGDPPPRGRRAAWLRQALDDVRANGGGRVEWWIEPGEPADDAEPLAGGFRWWRDLWQMRCALPAAPTDLPVRPFTPADGPAFLAVNNRAFAWHPEQGNMTPADLAERIAEPWFDPDGFLLHDRDGRLAGFCWTKVHAATATDPAMGEIYAIAVDPDFHGQGIGGPLTRSGLQWLNGHGLTVGMLYVEHDNAPAIAVYHRIGFTRHHSNRAYECTVGA
jgi:mycothiol synthase